ncbi:MAG: hypothetical protein WC852_06695 [Candidatus Nanoarchaeia archaeon]|jgi:hypothetical protein
MTHKVILIVKDTSKSDNVTEIQKELINIYSQINRDFEFEGCKSNYYEQLNELDSDTKESIICRENNEFAVAIPEDNKIFIFDRFWQVDKDKQFQIILHELGHIKYNYINLKNFSVNLELTCAKGLREQLAEQYINELDSRLAIKNFEERFQNLEEALLLQFISFYPFNLNGESTERFKELFLKIFGDDYEKINSLVENFIRESKTKGHIGDNVRNLNELLSNTKFGKRILNI